MNNTVSGNYDRVVFKVYTPDSYGDPTTKYTRTFNFSTILTDADGGKSVHPKFYYTGDFNGDGKIEIFAVSCHNPFGNTSITSNCYLFDLEANKKLYEGNNVLPFSQTFVGTQQSDPYAAEDGCDRLFVCDFNGDGKSDICLVNSEGVNIYEFTVSGSTYSLQKTATYTGLKKSSLKSRKLLLGELNGDGKPDLLLSPPYTNTSDSTWSIFYCTGNGQFVKTTCKSANYGDKENKFFMQDINEDGLTDLVKYIKGVKVANINFHETRIETYITGKGILPTITDNYSAGNSNKFSIIPVNITNRSFYYRLLALKDGTITCYEWSKKEAEERLLSGIASSLGIIQRILYKMLSDEYRGSYYTRTSEETFPYENFQGPMFVPVAIRQSSDRSNRYEDLSYHYENAVIHKQGLGFRGFAKITETDNIRKITSTRTFDPCNYGVPTGEETPVSKTTYTYNAIKPAANKILKIRMKSSVVEDKLKGATTTTTFASYDTYGNLKSVTIDYGDEIKETIASTYYCNTDEQAYLLGYLTDRTKTLSRDGTTYKERTYTSSHDNKGSPLIHTNYINTKQAATEEYTYDEKGLLTQTLHKDYTSTVGLITGYEYNANGKLIKETNPLGQSVSYAWNTKGQLSTATNHYNLKTTYAYDVWGSTISTTVSDGKKETVAYTV
ncbi:hypothetical protein FACS189446_5980 [Bacteroidia bacterium]|nr:hypothetical protein FACS189446_5980 [Bacteroidia bacterium]